VRSTARFSKDDIEKLRGALKESRSQLTLPQRVWQYRESHFIKGQIHERRDGQKELSSEKQRIQFLKVWVSEYLTQQFENLAWDVYAFLFHVPFEFVPMYLNDETLNYFGLVQWRLDIGK
jgi:hypothetical protein